MIRSFKHKGLKELFETGKSRRIPTDLRDKILRRLDFLHQAEHPQQCNVPGFDFHPLKGKPKRYSIHVNGNYCITFAWKEANAINIDFEDYH
jgi:proteic killer suppression protein